MEKALPLSSLAGCPGFIRSFSRLGVQGVAALCGTVAQAPGRTGFRALHILAVVSWRPWPAQAPLCLHCLPFAGKKEGQACSFLGVRTLQGVLVALSFAGHLLVTCSRTRGQGGAAILVSIWYQSGIMNRQMNRCSSRVHWR